MLRGKLMTSGLTIWITRWGPWRKKELYKQYCLPMKETRSSIVSQPSRDEHHNINREMTTQRDNWSLFYTVHDAEFGSGPGAIRHAGWSSTNPTCGLWKSRTLEVITGRTKNDAICHVLQGWSLILRFFRAKSHWMKHEFEMGCVLLSFCLARGWLIKTAIKIVINSNEIVKSIKFHWHKF